MTRRLQERFTQGDPKKLDPALTDVYEGFRDIEENAEKALTENANKAVAIGTIYQWPTATPPDGWFECDGSPVSRTEYAELFSVVSNRYGAGDGVSTFNLPNLVNRLPRHQSGVGLGVTGGSDTGHTHTGPPTVPRTSGGTDTDNDNAEVALTHSHTIGTSGTQGGFPDFLFTPVGFLLPYIYLRYIIKAKHI